ncbi:RHS repeat-associated core domain-containing protein [Rhodanobacter sp. DHB23]|uniref:RHS repeat-associated core domain-containing protein n=1 Tax=Rhodanobacter sp. DHB23 TaxID=2775923 RepID=UPI001781E9C2|nr:RHS repeat-associated core domain-containing protein [Rhodanobacter sp. DHB23]MBD8874359.1 RHS repeat-associated core domain-containing protein [Rhodanobacter sp. DHB23]
MKIRRHTIRFLCLLGLWLGLGLQAHAQTDTVTYVYTDPQGTPLVKADASGNVIARYDYTPYGNSIASLGAAPNGPGYTGHVNDPETGLVYMQARYYQPIGRFPSPDPLGPVAGNIYSFNRYAYANNNPIVNIDPTGRAPGDEDDFYHSAYPVEMTTFAPMDHGSGGDSKASTTLSKQTPYQASNHEANVTYHETASLKAISGLSDGNDLHKTRVDAAHVYNNLKNKSKFQDSGTLDAREQRALVNGYGPAVNAYKDSLGAVDEATHSADTTNGSRHFFVRDITAGPAQHVPSWANGNQIVHGPFRTTANGDGPIHKGDTVYIWINNTR